MKGQIEERDSLAVAIVGMRTPSSYGKRIARELSGALVKLSSEGKIILEQLKGAPNTTAGLTKLTQLRPGTVSNLLLILELQGLLRQSTGGLYERI